MTNSSETQLAYVAESVYGTTPSTPSFQIARMTSESLNANIENITSDEIRADRNVADLIQVGSDAGGNVNFELSYGSFDDWLESVMFNSWASNVLKNGATQKSFTLEKLFETGTTDNYHRFVGAVANTMTLNIQAKQIVTGEFGFMAKGFSSAQSAITGATYTSANSNDVINAASNFANLSMTGVSSPEITALTLSINNNLRQQPIIGSVQSKGIGTGRFEVTGELTAYFENKDLYELFINGTATDLSFTLGGSSSKKYQFDLGKIKFETGEVIAGGNDQDVMAKMTYTALYDGTDNTLKITRTP